MIHMWKIKTQALHIKVANMNQNLHVWVKKCMRIVIIYIFILFL